ncbi:AAA family ATPase [Corynebacterium amycolatum]|uniref:AAA family ATPase n=1 Tax=Corynebacterium amycolatum TaxID=43765 RepID=UPI000E17C6EA|nr:AAA family ATPase [Corynebacterium amycolatum]STB96601.1 ABC transporter [Corynebacterium amycolatum]
MIYLRHARIHDDAELPAYVVKLALPFPMTFTTPITILTGENGKGKSTVLEALASAMGVDTDGGSRFKTQERTSPIPLALTKRNPPDTFFFRGDAHLNLARFYASIGSLPGGDGMADLTQMSHGQSIMALAKRRFGAESLILGRTVGTAPAGTPRPSRRARRSRRTDHHGDAFPHPARRTGSNDHFA